MPVIDGEQNPLQIWDTVKELDWTVPEQGAKENVDVTAIFRDTDIKTLLLSVSTTPVVGEMLRSVPV